MNILTFPRGCPLTLTGLIGARIIVFIITIDLKDVNNVVVHHARVPYDATSRAGTTLGDG